MKNDVAAPALSRDIENVISIRQFLEGSICHSLESAPDQTRRWYADDRKQHIPRKPHRQVYTGEDGVQARQDQRVE